MAGFLLDANGEAQRRSYRRSLAAYLEAATEAEANTTAAVSTATSAPAAAPSSDSIFYFLVLSLLVHSPDEWRAAKPTLFRLALRTGPQAAARERLPLANASLVSPRLASAGGSLSRDSRSPLLSAGRATGGTGGPSALPRATPGRSPIARGLAPSPHELPPALMGAAGSSSSPLPVAAGAAGSGAVDAAFEATRPALVYFALVSRLQSILKEPRPWQPSNAADSAWGARTRERLRRHDQAVLGELGALLREYEQELLALGGFEQALDVLEIEIGASDSVDEYVRRVQGRE